MQVYIFSSTNLTNIWAGIGAGRWAVSEEFASRPGAETKAQKLPIGAFGLLYCNATQSFTVPFVVRSKPNLSLPEEDVWPETWRFPFQIIPLGTPRRQLRQADLTARLREFARSGEQWNRVFLLNLPFVASEVHDSDWEELVRLLADGESDALANRI